MTQLKIFVLLITIAYYFKALRNYQQDLILQIELDDDQNTLGHKAAFIGNSALFKVLYNIASRKFLRDSIFVDIKLSSTSICLV